MGRAEQIQEVKLDALEEAVFGADALKEEDGVHKEWYEQARRVVFQRHSYADMGRETIHEFMFRIMDGYKHGYGTVVHAIACCAIAAASAANRMEGARGGITGFQASAVMWQFIHGWMQKEGPLRLLDFELMLYPQYNDRFAPTISADTWKWLQDEAKKKLAELTPDSSVATEVKNHWESIARGVVPFGYRVEPERG